MRKHILGILLLIITFGIGFWASPIRFSSFAVGSSEHGGYIAFESTDFVKLSLTTGRFENSREAKESFENLKKRFSNFIDYKQSIIDTEENRVILSLEEENYGQGFCIVKKENYKLYEICSTSLWHSIEFEKQYFSK